MTLEDYKKRVEATLRQKYSNTTEETIKSWVSMSESEWESYMKNFSPEELPSAWDAGA